jgi:hypothetical protein
LSQDFSNKTSATVQATPTTVPATSLQSEHIAAAKPVIKSLGATAVFSSSAAGGQTAVIELAPFVSSSSSSGTSNLIGFQLCAALFIYCCFLCCHSQEKFTASPRS